MCSQHLEPVVLQRHSFAHLLAQALQRYIDAKIQLGTGPRIENGMYYDVLFSDGVEFGEGDKKQLTKWIKQLAKEKQEFVRFECPLDEGYTINALTNQTLKNELLDKFKEQGETTISYYLNVVPVNTLTHVRDAAEGYQSLYESVSEYFRKNGTISNDQAVMFIDLCAGPHITETKEELDPNGFMIDKIAGAYWQADENNAMMTRIYGLAFENKEKLQAYQTMMEEAKKRDHRLIGKQLELFAFDDEVGPGLPLWLPKGSIIVEELERFAKETEQAYGYSRVRSPHIGKDKLYLRSGHLPYYEEDMFPPMEMDNEKYYLKAMNCPHHHKIFGATPKSYRDLPARYAEYGHCYRYEDSGALFGLMRVRSLCMNDAHIYCTPEQFQEEFAKVIEMYLYYFKIFGLKKYQIRLSKHSKAGLGKKYVDNEPLWIQTEAEVRKALDASGIPYEEAEDEAAFYGPKIDVQVRSVIGREFSLATNQLDFAVPERFNLKYTDKDGEEKTPICIHRAPLSTHERLVGFLIEEYAGSFPVRLAPVQCKVVTVASEFDSYGQQVHQELKDAGIRSEFDDSGDSLNKKVRNAEKLKIPYILVIGQQEQDNGSVNVRVYKTKEQSEMKKETFLEKISTEYKERCL